MAKINKPAAVKEMTGLSAAGALAAGPDNVPAVITDQSGAPKSPAMIKEGEFIFSVEAVTAAGDGDHEKGIQVLTQIHDELRQKGMEMLQQGSLAAVEME